jgi:hypothetical protein
MFQLNPAPKPQHKRNKPTAAQRGAISAETRKALRERSEGICERCRSAHAVHAAHLLRRWQISERTTVNDLAHLCVPCHINADTTAAGREWLKKFQNHLISD